MQTLGAIVLLVVHAATLSVPLLLVATRIQMRSTARAAALGKVPHHKLTTLRLTHPEYTTALRDEGKEVFALGAMHDIVRTTTTTDSVIVVCVRDNAETAINAAINSEQNNAMGRDGRVKHMFRLILSPQIAILQQSYKTVLPLSPLTFVHEAAACLTMPGEPLVPPPRSDS